MKFRKISLNMAAMLLVAVPVPSTACTVSQGYKVPTTLELTSQADAIILARVVGEQTGKDEWMDKVRLKPEHLVMGTMPNNDLLLSGYLEKPGGRIPARFSDPQNIKEPNPDALMGGCNRYVFKQNMLLLLFLKRTKDGSFDIISEPFARTLEDVPDENALWVRAVRLYADAAKLAPTETKAKLEAERARLSLSSNAQDKLLADDIQRQLKKRRSQNYD